ncbi:hypothetical protein DRN39_04625 [Thermococci archaeon]|nr:MAG: hypothetical protein DRN39_04625 [Thermococci archaeon]
MPKPRVKYTADQAAEKWATVTPARSSYYQENVRGAGSVWEANTVAAEGTWREAITEAANRGAYGKGVKKAGGAKWEERTLTVGVPRWSGGIAAAKDVYKSGIARVLDVISRVELPPKGPKNAPQNYERVKRIGDALHRMKTAG